MWLNLRTAMPPPRKATQLKRYRAISSVQASGSLRAYRVKNCRKTTTARTQKKTKVTQSSGPYSLRFTSVSSLVPTTGVPRSGPL